MAITKNVNECSLCDKRNRKQCWIYMGEKLGSSPSWCLGWRHFDTLVQIDKENREIWSWYRLKVTETVSKKGASHQVIGPKVSFHDTPLTFKSWASFYHLYQGSIQNFSWMSLWFALGKLMWHFWNYWMPWRVSLGPTLRACVTPALTLHSRYKMFLLCYF